MLLASKIKKIRELKGFSQEFMADKLNISQSSYSRIEKFDKEISFDELDSISKVFEINPMDLLNFDDKKVFNNYDNESVVNSDNYYAYSEKERELYEKRITHLEKEVIFLRGLVQKQS